MAFLIFLRLKLYFFASGSKFCKFGPAITPTKPNNTKDPIPKPAAHGLKPPNAKDAKKSIKFRNMLSRSKHTEFMR